MNKTRSTDKGWVLRELGGKGEYSGRMIQYHPGIQRHFNGKPYWKVSNGDGKSANKRIDVRKSNILIMEDTSIEYKLSILERGLLNLSKNYNEQVKLYPKFVDVFDEVLSDFEDGFVLLPSLINNTILKKETILMIEKCNDLIGFNLKNEDLLTDESFKFSKKWNEVREYAKNAFDLLLNDIR